MHLVSVGRRRLKFGITTIWGTPQSNAHSLVALAPPGANILKCTPSCIVSTELKMVYILFGGPHVNAHSLVALRATRRQYIEVHPHSYIVSTELNIVLYTIWGTPSRMHIVWLL